MAFTIKPDFLNLKYFCYLLGCIFLFILLDFILQLQGDQGNSIIMEELMRRPLEQDDSRIVQYILKNQYIQPPSPEQYDLKDPTTDPSMGQAAIVLKIFNKLRNGFFVECGALDGETRSNTLLLEKFYGWRGLLVEGDPSNYRLLRKKNRKAWTAGCCLAVHPYPHEVLYHQHFNRGGIKTDNVEGTVNVGNNSLVQVQCFPLFSLLTAIGVSTVDYFSLDVEGNELEVLKTIPFEKVHIKVLSVELTHGPGGSASLEEFMKEKNYHVVTKLIGKWQLANDLIFVKNDFPIETTFPGVLESSKI